MKRLFHWLLFFVGLAFLASSAIAVTTAIWTDNSRADFEQGKFKQVAVTAREGLRLSNEIKERGQVHEAFIWCLAADSKGNIIAGTGDQGTIYKIAPDGKSSVLYRSSEIHVHAIVIDEKDNVYAGTSPRGIIYKITPDGQVTIFHDSPEEYIWSMAMSKDGTHIFAGTGPNGRLLKISMTGEASVLFDAEQSHILTLALDGQGNLYSGTEPAGIIYKTSPEGQTTVVYDAEEDEIHCLVVDEQGCVYAGTADVGGMMIPLLRGLTMTAPGAPAAPPGKPSLDLDSADTGAEPPPQPAPRPSPGLAAAVRPPSMIEANTVYKISPEGRVAKYVQFKQSMVTSMAADKRFLYIGTGDKGRLYKVSLASNREVEILGSNSHEQILSILVLEEGLVFATGNPGSVRQFSGAYASKGTFESRVCNAKSLSRWGRISWEAKLPQGASITVATRTGNSEKPDATWSPWSNEYTNASGENVTSPPGRYIQYRATLLTNSPSATPELSSVTLAYLPLNNRPEISDLAIDGAEKSEAAKTATASIAKSSSTSTSISTQEKPPEVPKHKSTRSITWSATDKDGDEITCNLFYKASDEKNWKVLKKEINKSPFKHEWDTETAPDGKYKIKVVASDSPSNPPGKSLDTEEISEPFVIDNTRPVIQDIKTELQPDKRCVLKGTALDLVSNILQISFSVDAADWVPIYPDDEIYDSKSESFTLTTEPLSAGEHSIVIKAVDAEGNVGSGKAIVQPG